MNIHINEAVEHYFKVLGDYAGNARDVKKADKHMDGFTGIFCEAVPSNFQIGEKHTAVVKGGFLKKRWDIAYGDSDVFLAALELKSIVLSKMGKCFTNRAEEAIGVATDLRHVNKNIKLNYFLVIEDDIEDGKNKDIKLNRVQDFCNYIENGLSLYNNVCCIVLSAGKVKELYSSLEDFIKNWRKQ